jgi:hypothetical protein
LYEVNSSDIPVSLITLLVNWYNNRLFHWSGSSSLFLIELISLWILERNISPPAWISSAGISSLPGDFYLFNFAIAISTSKRLGSGNNGSVVCISICLTSLTLCTFNNCETLFKTPSCFYLSLQWWLPFWEYSDARSLIWGVFLTFWMFYLNSRRWFVLCLVCVPYLVLVQVSRHRD